MPEKESARQYLLVAMDFFRKSSEAYPKRNQEAVIATKPLTDEFFTIFGALDTKSVHQGRGFEADVLRQVCCWLANAIGGTQCPTGGGEGVAGAGRRH